MTTKSTKTPCDPTQEDAYVKAVLKGLGIQIQEIEGCKSLVDYTNSKFDMTQEEVCDSTIMTLTDKFKETKQSKNYVRALRSNLQNDTKDPKIHSICKCTCPQGKIIYLILNT